eukprot:TRINITY_DN49131_c0_g1_i1.p1 TRINITY_DN49131_c0_g1~~TRINITY_DN49131_c0_g1_i1.p1  ORF type:complete len:530 (-),score=75.16 TRINITY_DN49131_c0_g1_i1:23-1585(-)
MLLCCLLPLLVTRGTPELALGYSPEQLEQIRAIHLASLDAAQNHSRPALGRVLQRSRRLKRDKKVRIDVGGNQVDEDARFPTLRSLYEVDGQFLAGKMIDMEDVVRATGGAHARLVFSEDGQFIVKVIPPVEWHSLHDNLDVYTKYLRANPNSMLPRFFSAFKYKDKRWVAMFNFIRPGLAAYQRLYDLKGTSCSIDPGDRLVRVDLHDTKIPTLKDLNFIQNEGALHVPEGLRSALLGQLRSDTSFLQGLGLMDYSLVVHVSSAGECDEAAMQQVCRPQGDALYRANFQQQNGYTVGITEGDTMMHIYSFGIIDVLQPYNFKKSLADWYKLVHCGSEEARDTVDPKVYQKRFVKYFEDRMKGDARALSESECGPLSNDRPWRALQDARNKGDPERCTINVFNEPSNSNEGSSWIHWLALFLFLLLCGCSALALHLWDSLQAERAKSTRKNEVEMTGSSNEVEIQPAPADEHRELSGLRPLPVPHMQMSKQVRQVVSVPPPHWGAMSNPALPHAAFPRFA